MRMEKEEATKRGLRISEISLRVQIIYFLVFVIGLTLNFISPLHWFSHIIFTSVGLLFILLAPFLIAWAQSSSISFKERQKDSIEMKDFCLGPYKYTRHPTYLGVTLLLLGFGLILNSAFVVLGTLLGFVITYFYFRPKEEKLLEDRYGQAYRDYKKKVISWL